MNYRPLKDAVFLAAMGLFLLNQAVLKPLIGEGFVQFHWNDLLLVPCAMPLVVWLHQVCGLREGGCAPTFAEIAGHLVIWAVLFEFLGPRLMVHPVGDWKDVACYWLGGIVAWLFWSGAHEKDQPELSLA